MPLWARDSHPVANRHSNCLTLHHHSTDCTTAFLGRLDCSSTGYLLSSRQKFQPDRMETRRMGRSPRNSERHTGKPRSEASRSTQSSFRARSLRDGDRGDRPSGGSSRTASGSRPRCGRSSCLSGRGRGGPTGRRGRGSWCRCLEAVRTVLHSSGECTPMSRRRRDAHLR